MPVPGEIFNTQRLEETVIQSPTSPLPQRCTESIRIFAALAYLTAMRNVAIRTVHPDARHRGGK
jgi:hypothetical protein